MTHNERKTGFNDQAGQGSAQDTNRFMAETFGHKFTFDMASAGVSAVMAGKNDKDGDQAVIEKAPEVDSFVKPKKPSMYKVLVHNDDTTPFDFVIHVLQKYFDVPAGHAGELMWSAHQEGRAVVAVYAKDIAEAKTKRANDYSRSQENPMFGVPMELTFSCEKE